jgi:hypothetical protein
MATETILLPLLAIRGHKSLKQAAAQYTRLRSQKVITIDARPPVKNLHGDVLVHQCMATQTAAYFNELEKYWSTQRIA